MLPLILLSSLVIGQGDAAKVEQFRRHGDGPLSLNEFKAKPAAAQQNGKYVAQAYTQTDVRYDFNYRVRATRTSYIVQLNSIKVYAAFYPHRSWTRGKIKPQLLGHEQGHFDITEIHALRVQAIFDELRKKKKPPQAVSKNRDEAIKLMIAEIDKIMAENRTHWVDAQEDYDRQTNHSENRQKQAESRRVQLETLKELRAKQEAGSDKASRSAGGKRRSTSSRKARQAWR